MCDEWKGPCLRELGRSRIDGKANNRVSSLADKGEGWGEAFESCQDEKCAKVIVPFTRRESLPICVVSPRHSDVVCRWLMVVSHHLLCCLLTAYSRAFSNSNVVEHEQEKQTYSFLPARLMASILLGS